MIARELLKTKHLNEGFKEDDECTYDISEDCMIEFAAFHVKLALKAAVENAESEMYVDMCEDENKFDELKDLNSLRIYVNENSILNSYNLENIK